MSTAVAGVMAHQDKYENDFNIEIAFLMQHIDKRGPALTVKVASVAQTRPAKWQNASMFVEIELKKYSKEEYDSMSKAK